MPKDIMFENSVLERKKYIYIYSQAHAENTNLFHISHMGDDDQSICNIFGMHLYYMDNTNDVLL